LFSKYNNNDRSKKTKQMKIFKHQRAGRGDDQCCVVLMFRRTDYLLTMIPAGGMALFQAV